MTLAQVSETPWYSAGGWIVSVAIVVLVVLIIAGNNRNRK